MKDERNGRIWEEEKRFVSSFRLSGVSFKSARGVADVKRKKE
jgi:hypothetical protein